mgnify:CR=1 FL=1
MRIVFKLIPLLLLFISLNLNAQSWKKEYCNPKLMYAMVPTMPKTSGTVNSNKAIMNQGLMVSESINKEFKGLKEYSTYRATLQLNLNCKGEVVTGNLNSINSRYFNQEIVSAFKKLKWTPGKLANGNAVDTHFHIRVSYNRKGISHYSFIK